MQRNDDLKRPHLWRAGVPRQTHETRTIIAKLKERSEPVRRLTRALAAGRSDTGGPTRLSALVDNGYALQIEPVFEVAVAPDAVRRSVRYLAAATEAKPAMRRARGLVEIAVQPGTDARDLAKHVQSMSAEVEYAYVPAIRHAFGRTTKKIDPLSSRQWGHGAVQIARARRLKGFKDGRTVTVAVVDSGIDVSHPDLKQSIAEYQNFVAAESDRDFIGHGTHVAGIIAAGLQNGVGIAGLCASRILALKALPRRDEDWSAKAYYRALRHVMGRAQVLNLSLGGDEDRGELDILQDLIDSGVVVVAAMGNEYEQGNPVEYPGAMPGVCAVGATDQLDRRASFSNTGPHIALAAPGVEILSTTPTYAYDDGKRDYDSWDGTSMATPHVAAAAALVLAASPKLEPAQVIKRMTSKTDRVPGMKKRPDTALGWGRLNIEAALR